MGSTPPTLIALDSDEYHAQHVGRLPDGRQIFVTTPFVPAGDGDRGREFIAAYVFDITGALIDARIDDLGPRKQVNESEALRLLHGRWTELGPVSPGRIQVQPFSIQRFGITFGLIPRVSDDDDEWWVECEPGNYMAFHEPWDSGEYDT
jgi:hypothetical protein